MKDYQHTEELERYLERTKHEGNYSDDRHDCSCRHGAIPKSAIEPVRTSTQSPSPRIKTLPKEKLMENILSQAPDFRPGLDPNDYGVVPPNVAPVKPSFDIGPLLPDGVLSNEADIVSLTDLENINKTGMQPKDPNATMETQTNLPTNKSNGLWLLGLIAAAIVIGRMSKKKKK